MPDSRLQATTGLGAMLEDDLELSKYWYRWAKRAHAAYGPGSASPQRDIVGYAISAIVDITFLFLAAPPVRTTVAPYAPCDVLYMGSAQAYCVLIGAN